MYVLMIYVSGLSQLRHIYRDAWSGPDSHVVSARLGCGHGAVSHSVCVCMCVCVCVCVHMCVWLHVHVCVCAHMHMQGCVCVFVHVCVCVQALAYVNLYMYILRVPDQNGASLLFVMLEIHHSGQEPLICVSMSVCFCVCVCVHEHMCVIASMLI